MAGGLLHHVTIGRVVQMTAGVAGNRIDDAGNLFEVRFNAPEATARENGGFKLLLTGTGRQHRAQQHRNTGAAKNDVPRTVDHAHFGTSAFKPPEISHCTYLA